MSDPTWTKQWDLFHGALELAPEQRTDWLRQQAGADIELLETVERLLSTHGQHGLLDTPSSEALAGDVLRDPLIGEAIGDYRITSVIGEGGMGIVYAAEQHSPRREVAVKLIRLGLDTTEIVRRFESERQTLARMNHPSIAQVFDGGITDDGRPYFVMERVRGETLNLYCDQRRLGLRARLDLFLSVCEGVEHAHRRGIVHRDLKPSNLLVSPTHETDATPIPKIIDFGVAKAVGPGRAEGSLRTSFGEGIGTPEYMSPEQLLGTLDIDTRTDVYALGVMLYELLAGARPFEGPSSASPTPEQMRERIRNTENTRPSVRLARLSAARQSDVSLARALEPDALVRALRGDLDWIALRALEQDREQRYGSVQELAADIRRHLDDLPVDAGPPKATYRARKFVRRHRTGVATAAAVTLATLAATAGLGIQTARLAAERNRANEETERALQAATTSEQVTSFLVDLFASSSPTRAQGESLDARELLTRGAERVRSGLADEPEVQARLLFAIGNVYRQLGLYQEALPMLEESLELRLRTHEENHPSIAESINGIGLLFFDLANYDQARTHLERSLHLREATLDPEEPSIAANLAHLSNVYSELGEYEKAVEASERAIDISGRALPADDPVLAERYADLAVLLSNLGRHEESRDRQLEVLRLLERAYGPQSVRLADELNNLAVTYWELEDYESCERYLRRSLALNEKAYGPVHPFVAAGYNNLGRLHTDLGNYAQALANLERSLELRESILGADNPETATSVLNLGRLKGLTGEYEAAIALYRRGIRIREDELGPTHPLTAMAYEGFARVLRETGSSTDAERFETAAARIRQSVDKP